VHKQSCYLNLNEKQFKLELFTLNFGFQQNFLTQQKKSSSTTYVLKFKQDPGFESACGGDCSPPPVDLSALDGLALDFPLNGCCNTDNGYGSRSSMGGSSPPLSLTTGSDVQLVVETRK